MHALRIKTAIRGTENEKGNQMSQVQTQDTERDGGIAELARRFMKIWMADNIH